MPTAIDNNAARIAVPGKGVRPAPTEADAARTGEIDDAARAFEKLLVQRMLGDMRRAARGGDDPSNAMTNWESMFDEEIAGVVTRSGGLGFADALSRSLGGSGSVSVVQSKAPIGLSEKDQLALRKLARGDDDTHAADLTHGVGTARGGASASASAASSIERPLAGLTPEQSSTASAPSARAVATTDDGDLAASRLETDFIAPLRSHAVRNAQRLGTRPEAILAVAALETGWGRHPIVDAAGLDSHNLFGIKATGAARAQGVEHRTTEFIGGAPRLVEATFQRFDSVGEAVDGFADFVLENPRYAPALAVADDPERFLRALHQAGYATDPHYADKVVELMERVKSRLDATQSQAFAAPDAPADAPPAASLTGGASDALSAAELPVDSGTADQRPIPQPSKETSA